MNPESLSKLCLRRQQNEPSTHDPCDTAVSQPVSRTLIYRLCSELGGLRAHPNYLL